MLDLINSSFQKAFDILRYVRYIIYRLISLAEAVLKHRQKTDPGKRMIFYTFDWARF